jgi:signal peptidase I
MRFINRSKNGGALSERRGGEKKEGFFGFVSTIFYALVIALVIRTVAYEPFNIPSESMLPTLLVGDYIFVSKFSYGYSRHSVIFSPPLGKGRIFESRPERGDVAVFKLPRDNDTDYIKRIIGLPGDRIQMRRGVLYINGRPVERERIDDFEYTDQHGNRFTIPQYRERLPNGVEYNTLDLIEGADLDDTKVYTVPPEHYFAMGNNRDNSIDSRVPEIQNGVGYVPAENLVGRAEFLFFSTDYSAALWEIWKWPQAIRFRRIFRPIE